MAALGHPLRSITLTGGHAAPLVDTIHFTDRDSQDSAFFLVRVEGTTIDLALSLESDGDLSVLFGPTEFKRLIRALQDAQRQLPPPS